MMFGRKLKILRFNLDLNGKSGPTISGNNIVNFEFLIFFIE